MAVAVIIDTLARKLIGYGEYTSGFVRLGLWLPLWVPGIWLTAEVFNVSADDKWPLWQRRGIPTAYIMVSIGLCCIAWRLNLEYPSR